MEASGIERKEEYASVILIHYSHLIANKCTVLPSTGPCFSCCINLLNHLNNQNQQKQTNKKPGAGRWTIKMQNGVFVK